MPRKNKAADSVTVHTDANPDGEPDSTIEKPDKRGPARKKVAKAPATDSTDTPAAVATTEITFEWISADLRPLAAPIDEVKVDPRNARQHADRDLAAIKASLERFGQRTPIVVNRQTHEIAKGNGTFMAFRELQAAAPTRWTHIAVVWIDDDPAAHHGYAIADNRTAELSTWDQVKLDELLSEYEDELGSLFETLDLSELLPDESSPVDDDPPKTDAVGDAWQVVVNCDDEADQQAIHAEMERRGYKCRLLTF